MFSVTNINKSHQFPGSFGRRASDGGANLQIFYPTSMHNVPAVEQMYVNANTNELRIGVDVTGQQTRPDLLTTPLEAGDESNDEIQRLKRNKPDSQNRRL